MSENLREYHRGLALYVVAHSQSPLTAAEVAEHMGTLAMSEGHPRACFEAISAPTVLGWLRALENAGLVGQGELPKRDTRNGRTSPTWRYSLGTLAAKKVQIPDAPPKGAPARAPMDPPPADESPYAGMTRQQLYAVLEVSDLYATQCAQFMQSLHDLNSRARRVLAAAGLGDLTGEQP